MKKLNPAIISLTEHIELNRAGWWDKTIRNIILGHLWLQDTSLSFDDLLLELHNSYLTFFENTRVKQQLSILQKSDEIIYINEGYKLSERCRDKLDNNLQKSDDLERRLEERFKQLLKDTNIIDPSDYNSIWTSFMEDFLLPAIYNLGSKSYEYLIHIVSLSKVPHFDAFLENFSSTIRKSLRAVIDRFLDIGDNDVKLFMFQHFTAYFMIESCKLSENNIELLDQIMKRTYPIKILVDTNLLFYLLNLDDGDVKQSTSLLKKSMETKQNTNLSLQLYVHPLSMSEFSDKLKAVRRDLSRIRCVPNIITAGANSGTFSGLTLKYFQEVNKVSHHITPDQYFKPFLTSLPSIVRENGIEIFNEKIDKLRQDENVQADIESQEQYHTRNGLRARTKSESAIEHDVLLWHFAKNKRPEYVGSILDAEFWIVTLDRSFISFDKSKAPNTNGYPYTPICIHPSTLIQMLQLWTPRSKDFETAFLASIRPLLTHSIDPDAEKTAARILEKISRFENVSDLPDSVIIETLTDEMLQKEWHDIGNGNGNEKKIALIESSLVNSLKTIAQENENLSSRNKKNEAIVERERAKSKGLIQTKRDAQAENDRLKSSLQSNEKQIIGKNKIIQEQDEQIIKLGITSEENTLKMRERISELENSEQERKKKQLHQSKIRQFMFFQFLPLSILGLIIIYLIIVYLPITIGTTIYINSIIAIFVIIAVIISVHHYGNDNEIINSTILFKLYQNIHRWVIFLLFALAVILFSEFSAISIFGIIFIGLITNSLSDWLKPPKHNN